MRKGVAVLVLQLAAIVLFIAAVVWGVHRHRQLQAVKHTESYRYGSGIYVTYVAPTLDHREPGPLCEAALKAHPAPFVSYDAGKAKRGCLDAFGYAQQNAQPNGR